MAPPTGSAPPTAVVENSEGVAELVERHRGDEQTSACSPGSTARSAFFDATDSPSTDTATHDRSFNDGTNPSIAVRKVSTDSDRDTIVDNRLIVNIGDVDTPVGGAVVAGASGAGR